MTEKEYRMWLCAVVTDNAIKLRLLKHFTSAAGVYEADAEELENVGVTEAEAAKIAASRTEKHIERLYRSLDRCNARFVSSEEETFPEPLRVISDAPVGLFYQGTLPKKGQCSVAIVGTRLSSPYGEDVAVRFGRVLSEAGVTVVSGLAYGIDAAAHRGAVEGGGSPVAVLGSGIGTVYPKENAILYKEVVRYGCVMSEYAPGVPGLKHHFPHRNRLISGLSEAVIVVEAKLQSGTMITVDRALEQGRDVYAVPGRITDKNSEGCHRLIVQGAQLVTDPGEILAGLRDRGWLFVTEESDGQQTFGEKCYTSEKNEKLALASEEKMVYAFLRLSPKGFDRLVWESGLTPSVLMQRLYSLERDGLIRRTSDGMYCAVDQ
ncbi:MAG: DNA-processing protein DprA [Lachnospiraceae bacterium]|nr:DNA-processing protein DprA [Lachnospiraceae bacterium]